MEAKKKTRTVLNQLWLEPRAELVEYADRGAIQGDCASAEVHRRMSETYGERKGTRRMTNMVIQSQASWGTVERVEKGKRVTGKPISVPSLQSLPVLFPYRLYPCPRCPDI